MKISDFSTIEEEFIQRVHDAVWCNVSTINTADRPRSRVLHPIWESKIGWVATARHSLKTKHLEHNPYISATYMKDPINPVYVDCTTEWVDNMEEKRRIWNLLATTPEPLGYDPALFFGSVDNPAYGLLKLIPWRIELYTLGGESKIWHA